MHNLRTRGSLLSRRGVYFATSFLVGATITLNAQVAEALSTSTPSAVDPCIGVKATKGIIDPLIDNVLNWFKEFGPRILIVLVIVGIIASIASRGGPWFKRVIILFVGLIALTAIIQVAGSTGGGSRC